MELRASIKQWIADHRHSGLFNKYFVAFLVFFVWLAFFDRHNLIVQYKLYSKVGELKREKDEYAKRLQDVEGEKAQLEAWPEQYAREKYYMHKPDEEVFIIRRK
jgi:cell division protein FtsB